MRETWYVLEDGRTVDPNEVAPDEQGTLRHSDGVAVAMRGQTPSSRGVNPAKERAKAKSAAEKSAAERAAAEKTAAEKNMRSPNDREMRSGQGGSDYETR